MFEARAQRKAGCSCGATCSRCKASFAARRRSSPEPTQQFFEAGTGHDFARVRVRDDSRARSTAAAAGGPQHGGAEGEPVQKQPREPAPEAPARDCGEFASATIDFVKLHGSTRDPSADLTFANNVFRQCCVRLTLGQSVTATAAQTNRWLGRDTTLQREHSCSAVHAEEESMRAGATAAFSLTSRYRAFYVSAMSPALRGVNFSPDCSSGARAPFNRHLYVANSAADHTLAHELAHIPIPGLDDHTSHGDGAGNLMQIPVTGTRLTRAQCGDIARNI